jgi:hypothetical protein
LGYITHQKETDIMNKSPVGVGIRGFLHGFSALYGLFTAGFLLVFAMSFILSGIERSIVMGLGLAGFLAFCILGVVLKKRQPDIFLVKEERHLTITLEGAKIPGGEITTEMTAIGTPEKLPQIEKAKGKQGKAL